MAIVGAIAVPHPPLIVPAVGRGDERRIHRTIDAYQAAVAELLELGVDCLVVSSPHAPLFRDAFHVTTDAQLEGSMAQFRAPQERIRAHCDTELAHRIVHLAEQAGIPAIGSEYYRDQMDHATFVPLYFVREVARELGLSKAGELPCPIVRLGLSGLPAETHRAFGTCVARAAEQLGRRVGYIASGDLSHKLLAEGPYGFAPEGPVFDQQIGQIFDSGRLEGLFEFDEDFVEAAAECGLRSFQIMAGAIDGLSLSIRMRSNEGPFGVGYGVASCLPPREDAEPAASTPPDAQAVDPYVALARLSVETYVQTGRPASVPADVPAELLQQQAGAFVSLHKFGQLRGCMGTIAATCQNVAEEILRNGISSCSRDPRFAPVRPDELDDLEYSVDVLGPAEPIASPVELDPSRYGVIVTKGFRRGLLLPMLEGVDTVEEQLAIAKQKANISPTDTKVALERFEVVRHTIGGEPRRS